MNRFISLLLVVSILSSAFSRWMLEAGYEMNRSYIADKLCVNKAKPMLHCNGKCYLAKKIKAAEEKEKSGGSSQKERFSDVFLTVETVRLNSLVTSVKQLKLFEKAFSLQEYCNPIFQPPRA